MNTNTKQTRKNSNPSPEAEVKTNPEVATDTNLGQDQKPEATDAPKVETEIPSAILESISVLTGSDGFKKLENKEAKLEYLVDNNVPYKWAKAYLASLVVNHEQMLPKLVEIYRTTESRKDAVAKAVKETAYTESTCKHFYNAVAFAKEWHEQEVATLAASSEASEEPKEKEETKADPETTA
jgi:hypothetical protein